MDWLTFIAELAKALAWPVTIVIVLVVLRRPLSELIPLLQRLRYKDLELDFGKQVQALAVDIQKELPAAKGAAGASKRLKERLTQLARSSPRAAVLEAWLELEDAAIEVSKRHHLKLTSREMKSPSALGEALGESGILDDNKQAIFYRLRNLRNAAAHASDFAFDADSAVEYANAAMRLADYLRKA